MKKQTNIHLFYLLKPIFYTEILLSGIIILQPINCQQKARSRFYTRLISVFRAARLARGGLLNYLLLQFIFVQNGEAVIWCLFLEIVFFLY
jgi:hypothetical protein